MPIINMLRLKAEKINNFLSSIFKGLEKINEKNKKK